MTGKSYNSITYGESERKFVKKVQHCNLCEGNTTGGGRPFCWFKTSQKAAAAY